MRIAVIGAGNVGRAIARFGVRDGHEVIITARHEDHAREAAAETGASPAASNAEAATAPTSWSSLSPNPRSGPSLPRSPTWRPAS